MNDYSLNEVASRARLAARGAGYTWGVADEVYRSVLWLVSHGFPAPSLLAHLLGQYESSCDVQFSIPRNHGPGYDAIGECLCPVMLGCALTDGIDTFGEDKISFGALHCPLLLLPFIVELASKLERIISLQCDSHTVTTDGCNVQFNSHEFSQIEYTKNGVLEFLNKTEFDFHTTEQLVLYKRVDIATDIWLTLDEFAHRTYAPATDLSRDLGAGAGTSDND